MSDRSKLRLSVTNRNWRWKLSFIGEKPDRPGKRFELDRAYVARLEHAIFVAAESDLDVSVTHEGDLVMYRRGGEWFCRDNTPVTQVQGKPLEDLLAKAAK